MEQALDLDTLEVRAPNEDQQQGPALMVAVKRHPDFRLFATQNPGTGEREMRQLRLQ
jgi:hypothetical protein